MSEYSVRLDKMISQLELEVLHMPGDKAQQSQYIITTPEVNRPGLLITGFQDYFDPTRIQILGRMEYSYLENLPEAERRQRLESLFSKQVPVVVITRSMEPFPEMLEYAVQYSVPLLRTSEITSTIMSKIINYLTVELAPRITRHGVLVEVYGEGIFLIGESGVGKSETAVELVKRGHRLIADDAVELRRVSNRTIMGTSPENIRYFVELRGVGIINVAKTFGVGAVNINAEIDMVIELQPWDAAKNYSKIGLEDETTEILDVKIPISVIPVRPGRNLAIIIETAAINNRQKKMGYSPTQELLDQLGLKDDISTPKK